jgi:transposase
MSERRKYDPEFGEGAVTIVRETGRPIAEVAGDLGVGAGSRRMDSSRLMMSVGDGSRWRSSRMTLAARRSLGSESRPMRARRILAASRWSGPSRRRLHAGGIQRGVLLLLVDDEVGPPRTGHVEHAGQGCADPDIAKEAFRSTRHRSRPRRGDQLGLGATDRWASNPAAAAHRHRSAPETTLTSWPAARPQTPVERAEGNVPTPGTT